MVRRAGRAANTGPAWFGKAVGGGGVVLAEELMRTSPLVANGVVHFALEEGLLAIEGSS